MGILTIILFVIIIIALFNLFLILKRDYKNLDETRRKLGYIKSLGLFALVTGMLGQMVGLYSAFGVIENVGDVSTGLLAGGLKVSLISPLYGGLIFLISYLLWVLIDWKASVKATTD